MSFYRQCVLALSCMLISSLALAAGLKQGCGPKFCQIEGKNILMRYQAEGKGRMLIHLSAKTTGWVAVGFGATHAMKDANIVIGYVSHQGKMVWSNDYGVSAWRHQSIKSLGGVNEVKAIKGYIKEGWTHLVFTIPLKTKDLKYGKNFQVGKPISVILAYGKNNAKNLKSYHQYKAQAMIASFKLPHATAPS